MSLRGSVRRGSLGALLLLVVGAPGLTLPPEPGPEVRTPRRSRALETHRGGSRQPTALAFSPKAGAFLVLRTSWGWPIRSASLVTITPHSEPLGATALPAELEDAFLTMDGRDHLLFYNAGTRTIVDMTVGPDGRPLPSTIARFDVAHLGIVDAGGATADPAGGTLFILDRGTGEIVRIEREAWTRFAGVASTFGTGVSRVGLPSIDDPRGIAFDPISGHLHILSPGEGLLYELHQDGAVVDVWDVGSVDLHRPRSLEIAPSSDRTDDPARMSLYIADTGPALESGAPGDGAIVEVSLTVQPTSDELGGAQREVTTIGIIDTSLFDPPAPDPAGLVYLPSVDQMLIVDSEVNETVIFAGVNVWFTTLSGTVLGTAKTTGFSYEPTGVTLNPSDGHLFFSDDDAREIHEVDRGGDGLLDTADDSVTSFSTSSFGSNDPEGVTFDTLRGHLFVVDGQNREVYEIRPGGNGVFDGVPPAGDDSVLQFDVQILGLSDPEGIAFNPLRNTLSIVDGGSKVVIETTTEGTLIGRTDIAQLGALKPAGLAWGPGSQDPDSASLYISDRGVDNNSDPNENDGMVFEISSPGQALAFGIDTGSDDAEESPSGSVTTTSPDLDLVRSGGDQTVGLRFRNVTIPRGVTVNRAYIQFTADETQSESTELEIRGERTGDAAPFSTASTDLSSRSMTESFAPWSPAPWSSVGQAGLDQQTSNLSVVLQEIVDRPDWSSGNSIALFLTGTGKRAAESYEGDSSGAAALHVSYSCGLVEIGCDGLDNDCDPTTSDVLDADLDGTDCDVDCNDGRPDLIDNCDVSAVLRVSSRASDHPDFDTIQEAVDAAFQNGTTIEIWPGFGTYYESVVVDESLRLSLVAGGSPLDEVVIHGTSGPAFDIRSSMGGEPVLLRGLTIEGDSDGIRASAPITVVDVEFRSIPGTALDLDAWQHDAVSIRMDATVATGVDLAEGAGLSMSRSMLEGLGGTALNIAGTADLENVLVAKAANGIVVSAMGTLGLGYCTVVDGTGAGVENTGGLVTAANTILWGNAGGDAVGLSCSEISWSNVGSIDCTPTNNNLSSNPMSVDAASGDYRLQSASPSADHGPTPSGSGSPCTDLGGVPRWGDSDGDGLAEVDIGAYELENSGSSLPEVAGLLWSADDTLNWIPESPPGIYHVYVGNLSAIGYDYFGTCADASDPERSDTTYVDPGSPAPGEGFFYLVTVDGGSGAEGTLGLANCSERSNFNACP